MRLHSFLSEQQRSLKNPKEKKLSLLANWTFFFLSCPKHVLSISIQFKNTIESSFKYKKNLKKDSEAVFRETTQVSQFLFINLMYFFYIKHTLSVYREKENCCFCCCSSTNKLIGMHFYDEMRDKHI